MVKRKIVEEENCGCESHSCKPRNYSGGCGGAFYGLGFVGALIYNLSVATSFWAVILGILKSIVWPAFLVYGLLKQLGM